MTSTALHPKSQSLNLKPNYKLQGLRVEPRSFESKLKPCPDSHQVEFSCSTPICHDSLNVVFARHEKQPAIPTFVKGLSSFKLLFLFFSRFLVLGTPAVHFFLFCVKVSLLKLNMRTKGTLIVKGLLGLLVASIVALCLRLDSLIPY